MADDQNVRRAVREGEFNLGGVVMRVAVLDDDTRVIEAESLMELFSEESRELADDDVQAFAHFMRTL